MKDQNAHLNSDAVSERRKVGGKDWAGGKGPEVLQWAVDDDDDSFTMHAVPASPASLGPSKVINGATMAAVLRVKLKPFFAKWGWCAVCGAAL